MSTTLINSVLLLGALGMVAAMVLFVVSKYFYVYEDPMIGKVEDALPATNCGGCGSPGCRAFAEKLVGSDDISDLFCPVGGNDVMQKVASILGKEVKEQDPYVAVLRCNGACDVRPKTTDYQGPANCTAKSLIYSGETDCQYGCLGEGDCVKVCHFDAMYMDSVTNLPVIISENCTACNACVVECPRDLLELRPTNKKDLKIYVACMNEDKGGIAKKACDVACIGCSKCVNVCPKDAIDINNFLAYIDYKACTLCRKCVEVCPTNAIIETNFPPRKPKKDDKPKSEINQAKATVEVKA